MERRFENQTALVVGGANGIGRAIALRLGQEGAEVISRTPNREPRRAWVFAGRSGR